MSRAHLDLSDERLGEALGRAMHQHVRSETSNRTATSATPALVRAGARRRRNTRRVVLATACAALVGVMGIAVFDRTTSTEPAATAAERNPIARPDILPEFAVLDADLGLTAASVYAVQGGGPIGAPSPAIDVWRSGEVTLVVRTMHADSDATTDDTPVTIADTATTAAESLDVTPWRDRPVESITVRGVAGAIEELAADQFEIWIPSRNSSGYTAVISRGLDRTAVLVQVEALVPADGALRPANGFTLTEQVPALPASTPSQPYAHVVYDLSDGPWLSTWRPTPGVTSLEGATTWAGGRLEQIDGRDVLVRADPGSRVSVRWIDPSGVMVDVTRAGTEADALVLARHVQTIGQTDFTALAVAISRRIERDLPLVDHTQLAGLDIERRGTDGVLALCFGPTGAEPACAAAHDVNGGSIDVMASIDGRWYGVGYRPVTDDYTPSMDGLSFIADDGRRGEVTWNDTNDQQGLFYVVDLGTTADTATTNVGTILGGIVGTISRPIVPSLFG